MRIRLVAVAALGFAASLPAFAADYPVLRGTSSPSLPPPPMIQEEPTQWDGFYMGGLAGYSSVIFDPRTGAADVALGGALRSTAVENEFAASRLLQPSQFSTRGINFGAFLGYNMQFGEAVIGFEVDYMRFGKGGSSTNSIGRSFTTSVGYIENVSLTGGTTAKLNDLVTMRLRTGYAMGNIMPYMTGGLALGYGTVNNTALVNHSGTDADPLAAPALPPFNVNSGTLGNHRRNAFMAGFTVGGGVEAMLGGLIVRGEYLFNRVAAQGGVVIDVNQGRVGAGVKF
ncbi:MAG: outer membrane protein [Bosea sp. (in: a-proteobacteria)]|jgi:outer membrane immunogenic protein